MDLPVYFISDIHLMLKRTNLEFKRQEILFQFLQHIGEEGGTLVINGDLFDFYFEYKDVIPKVFVPFYHEILKLRERGVKVHFVLGNHDYWVQDFITDTLFDKTYFNDTEFIINEIYQTHMLELKLSVIVKVFGLNLIVILKKN